MNGWIKLHRKITQTSFYKDSQAVHLAIHLLLKANHSDVKIIFNNEEVSIKRGSMITGRHALSRETGIHESTIYRKLKVLEKVGFSHIKSNNKYSIITIINYDAYNCINYQGEQHIEQPENNQRTQTRMNKNDKKKEKELSPLQNLWNTNCIRLKKVAGNSKSRRDKEVSRLKERDLDSWAIVFGKLNESDFCCGENDKNWKVSYDWIIKNESNALKVLEGNFENAPKKVRYDGPSN
tara:strand:+ start:636 stop:1346 length:711 start_codon:yes stop_codon:yes gene_type:complete